MQGKRSASGVDNTVRRTWDKEEYRKKAEEEAAKDKVGLYSYFFLYTHTLIIKLSRFCLY